jgi:N6-adenosine-specific RNA methylase IME4
MSVEDICGCLPFFRINPAPDAVLFLWRLASMQEEALAVIKAWGFSLKSEIVWEKKTAHGKDHFGMGRFVRAAHETCLIAERGRCKPAHRSQRSRFAAPVPTNAHGRPIHSAKPEAFYEIVRAMYPDGPRVELFARRAREGFTCLGNEVGKLDTMEAA